MYVRGKNRIFYQMNDNTGDTIEIDFISPDLKTTTRLPMTYTSEGLYYIDIWFKSFGSYVVRTFKNNIKLSHNIIQVDSVGHSIYPEAGRLI
jgi:hypothetical protein